MLRLRWGWAGFAATLAIALSSAAPAFAADQIYWGDDAGVKTGPLSGGTASTLYSDNEYPTGEAVDPATGKIYWDHNDTGAISVGNLDGSGGAQNLFTDTGLPLGNMGIDTAAGKLYWTDAGSGLLKVGNLDGTGTPQTLFSSESEPIGVAIDPAGGKMYWADWGDGTIRVGNLSGTGTPQTLFSGEGQPYGVAIDLAAGKIYWADQSGLVRVGNLNGTGTAQTLFSGEGSTSGVAVDPSAGKVYWGTQHTAIRVGNTDGTGAQTLFSDSRPPVSPVLLRGPVAAGVPVISGASTPGSTLTCSQGAWAPDLPGAFLYRSPQSYAYAWSENGKPIPGASNTITASSSGSYTCTVTATNHAGQKSETSAPHAVAAVAPKPPTTSITGAHVSQSKHTAKFTFSASAGATGFKCALVKRGKHTSKPHFTSCKSGKTYKHLKPGSYTFEVKATSAAGTGPVAKRNFKINKPKPSSSELGEQEGSGPERSGEGP